ncbi:glycosyltransferase [Oceanobacillus chungangensis]|uniref:DUF3880 domain-containing protein n=1 Tax=Oceanobacillus chungangensis TaxID=1229152 RepID=A0A3D8PXT1_9BACI|nr:glycosyltransferase [Oceanobacillus chungangensis]RDW20582.1 hypothetical protein CWR45_04925 [Oceanobacillus chungangensis]
MPEKVKEYHFGESGDIHPFETLSRDFFNTNNWYYPEGDIKLTEKNGKIHILSINEKAKYLTLFEKNTNFSVINKEEKKIQLGNENTIKISGTKSETIDLIIYLLEYDGDFKQVNKKRIHLNRLTSLIPSPDTIYCRIAIRISGQGEFEISNVFTSETNPKAIKIRKREAKKTLNQIEVVAIVNDEYLQNIADIVTIISLDDWDEAASRAAIPDLLLVDSTFKYGSSSMESGEIKSDTTSQKLKQVILWCKKNNIPTVFWDIDASIDVEIIREIFPLFDFIFTVDCELIPVYRQLVEHENIYQLPYAVNPKVYNPMRLNKKKVNQFFNVTLAIPKRKIAFTSIDKRIEKLSNLGVEIMRSEVSEEEIIQLDYPKNCTILINKENKSKSQSILSKSIIEVLASGIPIINRSSPIINSTFPGVVQQAWNENDIIGSINKLSTCPREYREISSKSTREIFRNHTYQNRLQYLLDYASIPFEIPPLDITLIFIAHSKEVFNKMIEKIENQSYQQIRIIALISVFDGYEEIFNQYNHDSVYVYLEKYVYENYRISDLVKTKYVSVLNTENQYDEYYVEDNVYAFHYSSAACVGQKDSNNSKGDYRFSETEFEYVDAIDSDTGFFEVKAIHEGSFYDLIHNQTEFIETFIIQKGQKIFSNRRQL